MFRAAAIALLVAALPPSSRAEGGERVREAVTALAATSYAWETTTRQRFSGENAEPRLNPNAALEWRGRIDPETYTEFTLMPSRELPAPVTAVSRMGDVVGHTPLGWLRRTQMRNSAGPDRTVEFGGRQVRLARVLTAALRVTAQRTPTEELFDLMADFKSYRVVEGIVIGELRDAAIERLWGDPRAKRAPEIHGTVIFKLTEEGLSEYHVVLGIGFPSSRTKNVAWSMMQWSTRISGIGTTIVDPPAEAVKALEE